MATSGHPHAKRICHQADQIISLWADLFACRWRSHRGCHLCDLSRSYGCQCTTAVRPDCSAQLHQIGSLSLVNTIRRLQSVQTLHWAYFTTKVKPKNPNPTTLDPCVQTVPAWLQLWLNRQRHCMAPCMLHVISAGTVQLKTSANQFVTQGCITAWSLQFVCHHPVRCCVREL